MYKDVSRRSSHISFASSIRLLFVPFVTAQNLNVRSFDLSCNSQAIHSFYFNSNFPLLEPCWLLLLSHCVLCSFLPFLRFPQNERHTLSKELSHLATSYPI